MKKSFYIYAYPRSGSHYLKALLRTRLWANSNRSHDLKDYNSKHHLISVVRNPLDAISSDASIGMYHKGYDPETGLSNVVNHMTKLYINTLREIYEKCSIIIDFEDLISNPEGTADAIAKSIGTPITNRDGEVVIGEQGVAHGSPSFVATAKDIPIYERVRQLMSTMVISEEANEIYRLVLSKAIDIPPLDQ